MPSVTAWTSTSGSDSSIFGRAPGSFQAASQASVSTAATPLASHAERVRLERRLARDEGAYPADLVVAQAHKDGERLGLGAGCPGVDEAQLALDDDRVVADARERGRRPVGPQPLAQLDKPLHSRVAALVVA